MAKKFGLRSFLWIVVAVGSVFATGYFLKKHFRAKVQKQSSAVVNSKFQNTAKKQSEAEKNPHKETYKNWPSRYGTKKRSGEREKGGYSSLESSSAQYIKKIAKLKTKGVIFTTDIIDGNTDLKKLFGNSKTNNIIVVPANKKFSVHGIQRGKGIIELLNKHGGITDSSEFKNLEPYKYWSGREIMEGDTAESTWDNGMVLHFVISEETIRKKNAFTSAIYSAMVTHLEMIDAGNVFIPIFGDEKTFEQLDNQDKITELVFRNKFFDELSKFLEEYEDFVITINDPYMPKEIK